MRTILLTGITGTVMGPLAALLLEQGHSIVALVRPKKGQYPADRLKRALELNPDEAQRLSLIHGDIEKDCAGISPHDLAQWKGKIDFVLHGAASIKLDHSDPEKTWLTNVQGTINILHVARTLEVPAVHYVSTLYVAGDSPCFMEQDLERNQVLRNPYEKSKVEAEKLVRSSGIPYSIYRIPIVVGNSQNGSIGSFSGYYGFFHPFWRLKEATLSKSEKENGLRICSNGTINLPLHIPCADQGPLQLVPIDWVTYMMSELTEIRSEDLTFHLTHPSPPRVKDVIEISLAYLGFKGMKCGSIQSEGLNNSTLQKMVLRGMKPYAPYTSLEKQEFGNQNLVSALNAKGKQFIAPPLIDQAFLERLLTFAIEKKFGE